MQGGDSAAYGDRGVPAAPGRRQRRAVGEGQLTGGCAMTLDKARELIEVQVRMAGGYNRNSAKLILAEVEKEHGPQAVDQLIREFDLEAVFGFKQGSSFCFKGS